MNSNNEDLKALALFLDAEVENYPETTQKIINSKKGKCIFCLSVCLDTYFETILEYTISFVNQVYNFF